MIVGFVLVLLAIAGGFASLAYVCRMRHSALRSQQFYQHRVARRPGTTEVQQRPAPLVQLKPVPTLSPAAEEEGTLRECPICFDEVTQNQQWLLLPCKHGVCTTCYQKLVQDQHRVTTCPLCRMPLLEPAAAQPPVAAQLPSWTVTMPPTWNSSLPSSHVRLQQFNSHAPSFVSQHLPHAMPLAPVVTPVASLV